MDHLRLDCDWIGRVLSKIYRLGIISEWPMATSFLWGSGGKKKFFEINMRQDAIRYILRHNFEKCYSVCTDFVASG